LSAATAITFGVGAATVAVASAAENIKPFGNQERLIDRATGAPMIGYTVGVEGGDRLPRLDQRRCHRVSLRLRQAEGDRGGWRGRWRSASAARSAQSAT
jgi:hypothetical protein